MAGETLFFGSNDSFIYALNAADGALLWKTNIGGAVLSSPALVTDPLYVGSSDGKLYIISRSTGEVSWTFSVGGRVWTSPAVVDGAVYFGSHDGYIYSIGEPGPGNGAPFQATIISNESQAR